MCATCGCGGEVHLSHPHDAHEHGAHEHGAHNHGAHVHEDGWRVMQEPSSAAEDRTHSVDLQVAVLAKNDRLARENRRWLSDRRITAVNLMSSPGAGKTTLLERT